MSYSVLVPTYNERKNIALLISMLFKYVPKE